MPGTCAKCGAALASDQPFCGMCGTPAVAAPPAFTPVPPPAGAGQGLTPVQPPAASGYTPVQTPTAATQGFTPVQAPPPPSGSGFTPVAPPPLPAPAPAPQTFTPFQPPAATAGPAYTPVHAAPPAATPPAYSAVQPPQGIAFAPAQATAGGNKSGNTAIKIILVVIAIFVGLGILAAGVFGFAVWRISRAIHLNGSNGRVTVQTPGGSISTNRSMTFTASELGAEIYPGAESTPGGMRMDLPTGSIVSGAFLTSDSKDAVVSFYKSKFGSDASVFDGGDSAVITLNKAPQDSVVVTVSSKPSENDGKTKIMIVHTKSKSS